MLGTALSVPGPCGCFIESDVTACVRIPEARDLLLRELGASPAVTSLVNQLMQAGGRPMLFAGAVRDALEAVQTGCQYSSPRDFDIGVVGVRRELFDEIVHGEGGRLNRFGGYRLITQDCPPLDLWRLEETLGVRVNEAPLTLGNVLRSFVISVNAVAFDPFSAIFYDCGSLASIKSRELDFVQGALLHSHETFAAKAIVGSARFGMDLQPDLLRFSLTHGSHSALLHESQKGFPGLPVARVNDSPLSASRHDALSLD